MIYCPKCQSVDIRLDHVLDIYFCLACGYALRPEEAVPSDDDPVFDADSETADPPGTANQQQLLFVFPESGRQIRLNMPPNIAVGRAPDLENGEQQLRLGEDGLGKGISRHHAFIEQTDQGVALVDQGSTNGTFLNGHQLEPENPYLLKEGDHIHFGHMLVRIYFSQ